MKVKLARPRVNGYKLKKSADGVELLIQQTGDIEEFRFFDSNASSEFINIKNMRELFKRENDKANGFHFKLTYNEKMDSMDIVIIYWRSVKDDTREYGSRHEEMPIIYRFNVKDIEVKYNEKVRKMYGYDEWVEFDKQEFYQEPFILSRRIFYEDTKCLDKM